MLKTRYQQAQRFLQGIYNKPLLLNEAVFAHWLSGPSSALSDCFWYQREWIADSVSQTIAREYRLVDAKAETNSPAFDHQALATALSEAAQQAVDAQALPLNDIDMQLASGTDVARIAQLSFRAFDQGWVFHTDTNTCQSTSESAAPATGLISPDGKKAVFTRDHNLWLRDMASGQETALTEDGETGYAYGCDRFGFDTPVVEALWSPDSQQVLTHQLDQRGVEATPIVHYLPKDGSLRPQLEEWPVSFPGDKTLERYRLVNIDIASAQGQAADYNALTLWCVGGGFFSNQRLAWWSADSHTAYFVDIDSSSDQVRLVELKPSTGATRILFTETEPNFGAIHLPFSARPTILPLTDSQELRWLSERSGQVQLYLYDLATGALKNPITAGEWNVADVLHIDRERRQLLVQTQQRQSDQPFYRDLCWVGMDSGELTALTSEAAEYHVYGPDSLPAIVRQARGLESGGISGVSPSGDYLVVTRSRVDGPPVSVLMDRSGTIKLTLETATTIGLPEGWQWPEPVTVKAAEGEAELYGVVFRPPNINPEQRYPVLDFSSAHPAYDMVPRTPFSYGPLMGSMFGQAAAYAALGFIVVMLDGPAQPYRRKALQAKSDGRMASLFGFPDRIAGIKQLAQNDPSMDLDRVGIVSEFSLGDSVYGLLEHPDFYRVGVCSDFEDIRYLPSAWAAFYKGFDALYADDMAASLQGKLLLIHSMLDPEPPVATTLRLADALQAADKDFDLVLLPTTWHEPSAYGVKRSWDFLLEHLLQQTPPSDVAEPSA